jgi:tetratricopeptide (TPR) repeat protein
MNAFALVAVGLAITVGNSGADDLRTAKELYAAAAYEEALTTLTRVDTDQLSSLAREVGQYRVFCLFALGRMQEAESAAEALIRTDALVQLDTNETSPRIQTMFEGVRKRLLPALIQDEYRMAKAARDIKNPAEAERHLLAARAMLDEARKAEMWNDSLEDLAVLVDGFLDLGRAAQQARAMTPAPAPQTDARTTAPTHVASAAPLEADAGQPRPFDGSDTDVAPPVSIVQNVPSAPPALLTVMRANQKNGIIDVLIDETGAVERVHLRESLHAGYDSMIVNAARAWKYRPAMKGGTPVRYMKTVTITVGQTR